MKILDIFFKIFAKKKLFFCCCKIIKYIAVIVVIVTKIACQMWNISGACKLAWKLKEK